MITAVRLAAAATAFLHKLQKGTPPWVPLKGREKKTYKQLQQEAIESKRRDLAVLQANDGVWPGVRIPSHALFLWASGTELTNVLEADHMPNKYIPKDLRYSTGIYFCWSNWSGTRFCRGLLSISCLLCEISLHHIVLPVSINNLFGCFCESGSNWLTLSLG